MTDVAPRVAFVTGTTHGIGAVTARELARAGYVVAMGCRDVARGDAVRARIVEATGSTDVHVLRLDLADATSIRACAAELLARFAALHLLVNNAGMMSAKRELTADGQESMFATNHLGPYLLTRLLLDRLTTSAPARIVNVASRAHSRATLDLDDLPLARGFSAFAAYGRSKLANVLFTRALARRLAGSGVTVNCLHPGVVATNIVPSNSPILHFLAPLAKPFMLSEERGAKTTLALALDPTLDGVSGAYFDEDAKQQQPSPIAREDALGERLWRISAELTRLPA